MKKASILIRTKNEARSLGATLEGVFSQRLSPHEVVIIDSGSRDRTLEIAAQYPARILQLAPRGWSYPRALNIGARQATGDFLVCLSAHCPPVHPDWLGSLLRHFDDPSVAAAWGPSLRRGSSPRQSERLLRQEPGTYCFATRQWGLNNANSALRRSLWLDFPFDESLPATEDKAWGREAMSRGYSLVYDPEASVWHERHPALNSFRRARAVKAGYHAMFPELKSSRAEELTRVGRRVQQELKMYRHSPSVRKLAGDVKKVPSVLGGLLGRIVARPP